MKVSICCISYNHQEYIAQALESFLMQKTSFNVEIVIVDDASTDNTDRIIRHYSEKFPDIIYYYRHPKNKGVSANFAFALSKCTGDFIATCEGDDYWTDELKLQKQVDFLIQNPQYTVTWSKYSILNRDKKLCEPSWINEINFINGKYEVTLDSLFNPYVTYTLTCLFRSTVLDKKVLSRLKYFKDNSVYCFCLAKGKGCLLDFFGGVYRLHNTGIFSAASEFSQNLSNYYNLKEINGIILNSKHSHLKDFQNISLFKAYYLACNQSNNRISSLKPVLSIYKEILTTTPFRHKLSGTKEIIKQVFLRL